MLVITYAVILVLVVINFRDIPEGYLDVRRLSETIVCRHRDCVCAGTGHMKNYVNFMEKDGKPSGCGEGTCDPDRLSGGYRRHRAAAAPFMLPQIAENISTFVSSADQYVAAIQRDSEPGDGQNGDQSDRYIGSDRLHQRLSGKTGSGS